MRVPSRHAWHGSTKTGRYCHVRQDVVFGGALLLAGIGFLFPIQRAHSQDTATRGQLRRLLGDHYLGPRSGSDIGSIMCRADDGEDCFAGDPDDRCWVRCRPRSMRIRLAEELRDLSLDHPESKLAMDQSVLAWTRLGNALEAQKLVERCSVAEWWCRMLEGHVYHTAGNFHRSEEAFREGFAQAPEEDRCSLENVEWLLEGERRDRYRDSSCEARRVISDSLWWLADPMYSVPGNDRWAEDINRKVAALLHRDLITLIGNEHPLVHQAQLERRGPEDSWERSEETGTRRWTSIKAAAYHFVPEWPSDGRLPWFSLSAKMDDEGYSPPYGPVSPIPIQVARFRQGDSLVLAVATDLSRGSLMDAPERSTHLVITSAPNDKPLQLVSEEDRPLTVFRAQVAPSGHLVSMEVLSAAGIGRRREFVEPLPMEGPGLSDLLLFRPRGVIDPTARDEAVGMMLGSAVSRDLGLVGLYWEEYGLPASDSLALELAIRKEDSGALAHLARVVGIGGVEGSGVISWIHLGEGGPPSRTMTLDLSRIDAGRYEVVLRVTGEHGLALESKQTLELIG